MVAQAGRDFVMVKNLVAISGARQLGLTANIEGIDVSDADDVGVRVFLAGKSGSESLDLSIEGVWKDDTFRVIAVGGVGVDKLLTDVVLNYADGATLTCDWLLSSYAETGEHKGEMTYTASLLSSGPWVLA